MADLKNSKTYNNLAAAFAGESMARNKYTFFASKAKKDGYEQISEIFRLTADNEKEHAEIWYKLLMNEIPDTKTCLRLAAEGENEEWTKMYKEFAQIADEEGFHDIAAKFSMVGAIEKEHEERYLAVLNNLENGKVFSRDSEKTWLCRNCGHIHTGKTAPEKCPVCDHAQAYFELRSQNY